MFSMGIKLAYIGVAVAFIAAFAGGLYWHIGELNDKIASQSEEIGRMESAIASQNRALDEAEKVNDEWVTKFAEYQKTLQAFEKLKAEAAKSGKQLDALFAKHNFPKLVGKKPGLIERRANSASRRVWRLFECTTGDKTGDNCTAETR